VKQTSTSFSTSVLTRLSAPFIARSCIALPEDVIARNGTAAKRATVEGAGEAAHRPSRSWFTGA
jgi:hypothetical protein